MITVDDFTRVNNDVNGNPRYVCHFLDLDLLGAFSGVGISERYQLALTLAKQQGGRKFHNKQYGGGIVFSYVYNIQSLCDDLNKLIRAKQ
jgi:hypothetical protein